MKEIPEKTVVLRVSGEEALVCRGQGKLAGCGAGELSFFPGLESGVHSCFVFSAAHRGDFLVYDVPDIHRIFEPKCSDAFPNLKDFISRFEVIPVNLLYLHLFFSSYFPDFVVGTTMKNSIYEFCLCQNLCSAAHICCVKFTKFV